MKKVLVVLVLVVMLVSVCACSYVPSTRFMSRSQTKSLVKQYDTPQAEVTLNYTLSNKENHVVKITYDLLLSQAPLAVVRFIQLANNGAYDDTLIDTHNSDKAKYMVMGRYFYKETEASNGDKICYVNNNLDTTFKGEFASNRYREPADGYAQFKFFSLAMYHEASTSDDANFDTANGAFILMLGDEYGTFNSNNYAVFAHMVSVSVDGGKPKKVLPNSVLENLNGFVANTSARKVYTDENMDKTIASFSMMKQIVTIQVQILGDYDWSNLPKIGK